MYGKNAQHVTATHSQYSRPMTRGKIINDLILGFVQWSVTVFMAFIVVVSFLNWFLGMAEAQTTDWPSESDQFLDVKIMEIDLENARIDMESAIKEIEIMMWDPTTYMQCLDYNTKIYRRAEKAGDTGLELSPQFAKYLKDCWKMMP